MMRYWTILKRKKKYTLILSVVVVVVLVIIYSTCTNQKERGELKKIWYNGSYNRDFNDLNDLHMAEAKRIGITPSTTRENTDEALQSMKKIETNDYYEVEDFNYSVPYLIPEAVDLLEEIGRNFQDTLIALNASLYKIRVTSATRTMADVQKLKKRNYNASQNSAHRYGTTFDISWAHYQKVDVKDTLNIDQDRLKMVLAMVLRDLKKKDRCYIKHERRQGCFHITVRGK